MTNDRTVIQTRNLTKELPLGKVVVHALRGVDLDIYAGEMVGIVGPSGSGKSTLLGLIGGLDKPTDGTIELDGVDVTRMNEDQLTEVRNEKIGFIFQFFNLIPTLTAQENVALPIQFARKRNFNPEKRAKELLTLLGMGDEFDKLQRNFGVDGSNSTDPSAEMLANMGEVVKAGLTSSLESPYERRQCLALSVILGMLMVEVIQLLVVLPVAWLIGAGLSDAPGGQAPLAR